MNQVLFLKLIVLTADRATLKLGLSILAVIFLPLKVCRNLNIYQFLWPLFPDACFEHSRIPQPFC